MQSLFIEVRTQRWQSLELEKLIEDVCAATCGIVGCFAIVYVTVWRFSFATLGPPAAIYRHATLSTDENQIYVRMLLFDSYLLGIEAHKHVRLLPGLILLVARYLTSITGDWSRGSQDPLADPVAFGN
jgi:hypothetical protein